MVSASCPPANNIVKINSSQSTSTTSATLMAMSAATRTSVDEATRHTLARSCSQKLYLQAGKVMAVRIERTHRKTSPLCCKVWVSMTVSCCKA